MSRDEIEDRAYGVDCPACRAHVAEYCRDESGRTLSSPHVRRVHAAGLWAEFQLSVGWYGDVKGGGGCARP